MTSGCLYFNAQGYFPLLLEKELGMSFLKLVGSWVELGFSVGMESFG